MLILKRLFYSVFVKRFLFFTIAISLGLSFSGCGLFRPRIIERPPLERISPKDYPDFADDMGYDGLEQGIVQSITYLKKVPPDRIFRFGKDEYDCRHMIESLERFLLFIQSNPSINDLKEFIAFNYRVYRSVGDDETGDMLFTGYYEPLLEGSLERSPEFQYPVFSLPEDLVFIDLSLFNPAFKVEKPLVGRFTNDHRVVPYYERREIVQNNLNGKSLPLAWVKDRVDLFFLEIQGSGKIYIHDGMPLNVHYHASNGRPYRSIGTLLISKEKVSREEMSMQKIREYLKDHPAEVDDILNYNPSFVFFRIEEDGPFGCFGVKVTPGRTVALQRSIFPAAALGFMESEKPLVDGNRKIQEWISFSRFVLNQDTGGAIKGPGRADLFWGNGPYAEIAAGHMKNPGKLYFLVLHPPDNG